jgi:hypothetical protein
MMNSKSIPVPKTSQHMKKKLKFTWEASDSVWPDIILMLKPDTGYQGRNRINFGAGAAKK